MKSATIFVLAALPALAAKDKITPEDRILLIRGMTAEHATVKQTLPRSKKPLHYKSNGTWDKEQWTDAGRENGPAARVGDMVRITKIEIHGDSIELEINGGFRTGPKWHERIQVGTGSRTSPISQGSNPTAGTVLSVRFDGHVPPMETKDLKKLLTPILDFEKRSATENYVESLPAPIQAAIKEKRAIEGMDKEQVMMAMGRPRAKSRETKDGVELEDWIYGEPPGRISFVTFDGNKVVKVKEAYAGLGGSVAEPLTPK
ncbi:MAG: hypothetical protein FJW39_02515 [Acidobacteria bacterium]|nr:hypothetical protein [Acidobacteriota bacterium]